MIVKILGAIDILAALAFLMLIFGIDVFTPYLLFCTGLLLIKSFFIFTGDVLSSIDAFSALLLFLSVFFLPFSILLWTAAFLLLAKGLVSFI